MRLSSQVNRYEAGLHPFIDYIFENKSSYQSASKAGFIDVDEDFLVGDSGGFLMKTDFVFVNTSLFTQVADFYQMSSTDANRRTYCFDKPGSINYNSFWKRETDRRRRGMNAPCKLYRKDIDAYNNAENETEALSYLHLLHITGDHYNYLNYGRIQRTPTKEERAELDRQGKLKQTFIAGFPRFWDGDYWNFKTDEFIARNGFHLCKGKSRRKGYSHKRGSQGANTINLNPDVTIILAAYDIGYLTEPGATTSMLKTCLDWYEEHTFWKRGFLSENLEELELGYKLRSSGNKKFGFRSKALSVTCKDNPNAAVGKAAVEIDFEESGVFPNLQQTINVTRSATEVGDTQVGTIRVYGTGGTKGANWIDFSTAFYHPRSNGMMPFENVWDRGVRNNVCGFFHPQIWNFEPHMDINGNSYLVESFLVDKKEKDEAKLDVNAEDYAVFCSQRANSPSEAFNIETENIFSSTALNDHIKFIRANESTNIYRDGQFSISDKKLPSGEVNKGVLEFITNEQLRDRKETVHPYITHVPFRKEDDLYGCWRIFHEPKRINGIIPTNLYYALIDTVGKDKTIKEITTKNSLNAIYILSYPNDIGVAGDTIQAIYVGRRDDGQEECSNETLKGCMYYNAKALPETDRGTVVADFKRWNKTSMLIKNPLAVVTNKTTEANVNQYGVCIGEGDNAVNAVIGLKRWLYEKINVNEDGTYVYRLHYIPDLPTLLEFQQYNIKGNFDRISALRLLTFERLAYVTKKRTPATPMGEGETFLGTLGLYRTN